MTCILPPYTWVSRLNRFGEGPDAMLFRTLRASRGCKTHNIRLLFDTTHTNIGIITIILYNALLYGCCIDRLQANVFVFTAARARFHSDTIMILYMGIYI